MFALGLAFARALGALALRTAFELDLLAIFVHANASRIFPPGLSFIHANVIVL